MSTQVNADQAISLRDVLRNHDGAFLLTAQGDGSLVLGFEDTTVEITTTGTIIGEGWD